MEKEKQINTDLILREEMALERTKMAAYRTLLAFFRTALYFPVAGISMHQALSLNYGIYLQWGGIIIGLVILSIGLLYYKSSKQKMKDYQSNIGHYTKV